MYMVVICWVSNRNNVMISATPLQALYTAVRYWEELIEFIYNNGRLKETCILTSMFKFTVEQDEENREYVEFYTHGQMMNHSIYDQILYNCFLSNNI